MRYVHHCEQTSELWTNPTPQDLSVMQPSRTGFFKTIHSIVTCKAQCNIILAEVQYIHEAILLHCLKYVGCWLSLLCIHSHFFLVFTTFSFIFTLMRHKHQLSVYVQISLKSQSDLVYCISSLLCHASLSTIRVLWYPTLLVEWREKLLQHYC